MSSSFLWLAELLCVTTLPTTAGSEKSLGSLGQAWQGVFAGAQQFPSQRSRGHSRGSACPWPWWLPPCSPSTQPAPRGHRGCSGQAPGQGQQHCTAAGWDPGELQSHPASSHVELPIPTAPSVLGRALDWHVLEAQPSEQPGSALSVGPCFSTHLHEGRDAPVPPSICICVDMQVSRAPGEHRLPPILPT